MKIISLRIILCLAMFAFASATQAQPGLPKFLTLSSDVITREDVTEEAFGEADFPRSDHETNIQRGHHWQTNLGVKGVPEDITGKALWARIKPALIKGGWSIYSEFDENPYSAVVRLQKNRDAWAYFTLFSAEDIRLELVDVAASKLSVKIFPPGPKPEKIDPGSGDFPYLPPLPGSRLTGGRIDPVPMEVRVDNNEEIQIVGNSTIRKDYGTPNTVSNIEFTNIYKDALVKVGWALTEISQAMNQSDAAITTHYGHNGRDIWAYLHYSPGELSISVADAGTVDLAQALKKDCHVPLYGVVFDFNKSTLRAESDPILARAVDALKANPGLNIEVQGHTDNVGTDGYNLKLSDARARTVLQWLTAHGVKAERLTSMGYGKNHPVADNDTDAGRAKNRRVELSCRK